MTEIQKDLAKAQVDAQKEVVEKAKDELEKAQETSQTLKAQLNQAKEINKEASPEAVAEAKAEVNKAEAEVNAKQASLDNSQNQELPSEQTVQQQENVVVGQRTLVDVAEREYNEAKAPIVREEQELAQAKQKKNKRIKNSQLNKLILQLFSKILLIHQVIQLILKKLSRQTKMKSTRFRLQLIKRS